MLWALIAVALVLIWVVAFVDVLRRHDLGTGSKVLWALAVLFVPVLGAIVYMIARPADATDSFRGVSDSSAIADERLREQHPF